MTTATIAVLGVGRIGAVTAVGMAHLLHDVVGIDLNESRVAALSRGELAENEPGLRAALKSALRLRSLRFETSGRAGGFDFVFLCVDTPALAGGEPDLSQVFRAAEAGARLLRPGATLVTRSTVPAGTGDRLSVALRTIGRRDVDVVHVPEFLREGRAWEDFREPDRIVTGGRTPAATARVAMLFAGLGAPIIETDRVTAELAKYAANAFLATSISFANEMSDLAQSLGADAQAMFEALRTDRRIGRQAYLSPGLGFGGHCLPKDTAALEYQGAVHGQQMPQLRATIQVNRSRVPAAANWLRTALGGLDGRRIAIAGIAFKPGTDDLRDSSAVQLAKLLASEGAVVAGFDPQVRDAVPNLHMSPTLHGAVAGADALVAAQHVEALAECDPDVAGGAMRGRVLFDAPGTLPAEAWAAAGFVTNRPVCPAVAALIGER